MSAADDHHTERSLGQLVANATADAHALLHDEIALLKAELKQDVKRGGLGGGAALVAGALVLFGIPVLSFAGAYGLHTLGVWLWASFLIIFGVHVLLAALVGLFAWAWLKKIKKPQKSIEAAKSTAAVFSGTRAGGRTPQSGRDTTSVVARSSS